MPKKISLIIGFLYLLNISFASVLFNQETTIKYVYDGDTILTENNEKIRVLGIDTPELEHHQKHRSYKLYKYGEKARKLAEKFLLSKKVRLYQDTLSKDIDKYHRKLRYLFIGLNYKGKKVYIPYGAIMIYLGYARVYEYENFKYKNIYKKLELKAKRAKRGIRSYITEKQKQKVIEGTKCGYTYHKTGCDIKGNISGQKKIYHIPGRKYYNNVKISPKRGEKWFCNEQEAKNCGRRPSFAR